MSESEFQITRIIGFGAAAAFALALQRMWPHDRRHRVRSVNVALWLINSVALAIVCGACACTAARWAGTTRMGFFNEIATPAWASALLSVLALDFVSYGWHRANHRLAFLWRFHQVHHSDSSFTVSTGVRFHPGELFLSLPIRLLTVVFLGVPVLAVVVFEVLFAFANLFEHGNIILPLRLERWLAGPFVTPALHRLHHARTRPELDSNFGTISTLWDRFMGTYRQSSSAARFATGLPSGTGAVTLGQALWLPLARNRDGSFASTDR
jgi:sterol desaturase/sphingolipid hydroxylase (fatty acid hydroxylase superfamily)